MSDIRYVDITSQLMETGMKWDDIVTFMGLYTIHGVRRTVSEYSVNSTLYGLLGLDLELYRIDAVNPSLKVHHGALKTVCRMFGLSYERVLAKALVDNSKYLGQTSADILTDTAEKIYQVYCNQIYRTTHRDQLKQIRILSLVLDSEVLMLRATTESLC